jgi:ankyrin repeat protein
MKLLTKSGTFIFILICFGLTEASAFQWFVSSQQPQANSKRVSQSAKSKPEPDAYCPDENEREHICTENGTPNGCNPLMVAAEDGDLNAVRNWLAKQTDPNSSTPGGQTPLTLAAAAGHLEVVKVLLEAGTDPNARGAAFHFGEFSALMSAMNRCNANWLQIMEAMIAAGAEVNPKGDFSRSPLMYAVELKNVAMIKALLAKGANVNLKNALGTTALMTAAMASAPSVPVVKLLLNAGANAAAQNNEGDTASALLQKYARDRNQRNQVARLLKQAGP